MAILFLLSNYSRNAKKKKKKESSVIQNFGIIKKNDNKPL